MKLISPPGLAARPRDPQAVVGPIQAEGRVYFWQGGSLWIGRGQGRSQWHEHHALQISLALDGVCRFRSDQDGGWSEFTGAIVRSHRHHEFEVDGATMAQLFVEPETCEGRALNERIPDADVSPLPEPERIAMADLLLNAYKARLGANEMIAVAKAAVAVLAGASVPLTSVHPRVSKAIEHIRANLAGPISLADVASAVALSPSRLRHLFVRETGVAFRVYLLWLRLNLAIEASMAGKSWTAAAQEAGFADSAHLTRTFKRMFGIVPAALVRR